MGDIVVRRVGIVGLGKMGQPMARHARKAGYEVTGLDPSAAARADAEKLGVKMAASPRALAEASDLVIVIVGFDGEVEHVICGPDGIAAAARPGLIVAVASTVAPTTMQRLAAKLDGSGILLLDMPLCRGEQAAEDGKLQVMVGGDAGAYEAIKPVLATFADAIFHLGAIGAGSVGKMVNNLILWACISANDEGFKLAGRLGVALPGLREALLASSAANWALETEPQEKPMPWAEKDMRIALMEADRVRLSMPLTGVIKEVVKTVKYEHNWPTPFEPGT